MKRSDSTNTLEETLDISSDNKDNKKDKKTELERISDIQYQTNPLKKSFSEDTVTSLIEQEIPLTPPAKIKSRSRLSSAFRSLRVTKSSRKKPVPESTAVVPITTSSSIDPTEGGLITSGEEIEIEQKPDDKDKIKKKTKLSKKFSLNIRKYRTTSKKSLSSSSEQHNQELSGTTSKTTTTLQYHPLSELGSISSKTNRNKDNNNKLNISQVSLVDLPSDNETEYDDNIIDDHNNNNNNKEKRKEIFKQKESKNSQHKQNILNRDGVNFIITSDSDKYNKENSKLKQQQKQQQQQEIFNEPESPLKFEKVRKIQITIKGKKIEHINRDKLPTTTTSISGEDDYLTATEVDQTTKRTTSLSPSISGSRKLIQSEQEASQASSKRQSRKKTKSNTKSSSKENQQITPDQSPEKSEKLVITQSSRDTPPSERAPPKPTLSSSSQNNSPDLNKGAIRKTPVQQQQQHKSKKITSLEDPSSRGDLLMRERSKSPLLERGRRYPRGPRPLDEELSAAEKLNLQNPKTGNNLQNPNLSGSIGVIEAKEIQFDLQNYPPLPPTPPTPTDTTSSNSTVNTSNNNQSIEFSVGKFVRSQPVSQLNIADSQQPDSILLPSGNPSPNKNQSNQTIERDRSVKKYQPRDIEYYTDEEERELIDGINRDSYLSGISEYSLDSELIAIQQQQQKHKEQYQQQKQKELRQQEQEKLVVMPAFGDLTMDNEVAPIMTNSGDKREHLYKILIIGELGTGKTSFIKRYVHKFFSQNYRATIGVDFALKVLHWDQNTIIRLQLWDIAGQERFGNMTRVYYKDAVGAFIVFDVTRSGTFECVSKWKEDLDSKVQLPDGSPIPCILLANKCDQEKQGVVTNPDKMDEYVKENGFAGWFETSAKENVNIDESARALVNKILLNDKLISAGDLDADKIDLGGSSGYGGSGGKKRECAC